MSKFRDLLKVGLALALCFAFAGVGNAGYAPAVSEHKAIGSMDTEWCKKLYGNVTTTEQNWDKKIKVYKDTGYPFTRKSEQYDLRCRSMKWLKRVFNSECKGLRGELEELRKSQRKAAKEASVARDLYLPLLERFKLECEQTYYAKIEE
jgi:hypothetical protein